jgi:hypothetical protein
MSLKMLRRRLRRLETQGVGETPYVDPYETAFPLFQWFQTNVAAVAKSKACDLEFHGPPQQPSPAKAAALAMFDRLAKRLTAPEPV